MRPAAILTAIAGIGTVAGLIAAGGERLGSTIDPEETAAPTDLHVPPPAAAARPTTNPEASMNARHVDDVSQFYPAVVDGKPLERIAAAEPEQPARIAEDKDVNLVRPVAESAGVLAFGERRLQLAGINPTPADKICTDSKGREWPCGMLAKTNVRLFLRLRTVRCDLDSSEWTGTVTAACRIGTQDISQWLVENGWAEAEKGSALAEVGEKARQTGKGLYGDDPRSATETSIPENLPSDLPLDGL
ncbi:endonuclease YncB(thermonuclease family) [Rhizobium tibeticum]|uniref:thermonuclease family protein n=1 Tax=Rhizobium tibeticum TaxID=501024 RepID=UPI00277E9E09|nr:thermonuclease family protein [Rhizobium tibeticum]MDP9807628.1 endonuclease YncB(thermonuclease family) [Rhizobium tibeticum]